MHERKMMRSTYWLWRGTDPDFPKGGGPSRIRRRSHPTPCPSVGDSRPVSCEAPVLRDRRIRVGTFLALARDQFDAEGHTTDLFVIERKDARVVAVHLVDL
jgi:hypothetical protein